MKPATTIATDHTVTTVCPLDCPDSCSLEVTVEDGRITAIDGSHENPVTGGYICAKVRRFGERQHGADRLLYPAIRKGPKGAGSFKRVSWDEALSVIADRIREARDAWGGESILPYSYGGSNGLLTQDTSDATLFRRLGASRLARMSAQPRPAPPTWRSTAKCRRSSTRISQRRNHRYMGRQPVGFRHSSSALYPRGETPRRPTGSHRPADDASRKQADIHLAVRPGTDLPVALAIHRYLFEEGHADTSFLAAHTRGADRLRERAHPWTFERAAHEAGIDAAALRAAAEAYASTSPAIIRCGWGQERNRNGGSASLAILALPAVAGKSACAAAAIR